MLRSIDVLHDFYVPEFRAKMDMVPGTTTFFWLTPIRTGRFDILCFELCGTGHYNMRGNVVVDSAEDYQVWLSEQITYEQYAGLDPIGAENADDRVELARDEMVADPATVVAD